MRLLCLRLLFSIPAASLPHGGFLLSVSAESKSLRDEEVLQTLPVGTTASFYFSDLGPQLTWGTVSPLHYSLHLMLLTSPVFSWYCSAGHVDLSSYG